MSFMKKVILCVGLVLIGINVQGCETAVIKKYILVTAKEQIGLAEKYGKFTATNWLAQKSGLGVTEYAYDAIPFEFFRDTELIPFHRLEEAEAIAYRKKAKKLFKKNVLGNKSTVNPSDFAEFFHCFAVDKMSLAHSDKELLKKDPIKLEEAVKRSKSSSSDSRDSISDSEINVDVEEYRFYVFLNYAVKCELERELVKSQQ